MLNHNQKECPRCHKLASELFPTEESTPRHVCGDCHQSVEDERAALCVAQSPSLADMEVPDDYSAIEGSDLMGSPDMLAEKFDLDRALAGKTNEQASRILEMVHDVESLEEQNARDVGEIVAGALDGVRVVMGGGN